MKLFIRKALIFLLKAGTILFVGLLLLICLTPFVPPAKSWFIAITGLSFPLVLILVFILMLIWILLKKKWWILPAIVLILSIKQITVFFAFKTKKEFNLAETRQNLRVLSWNVSRWDETNKKARGGESYRKEMIGLVADYNADILCFNEFFECKNPKLYESNVDTLKKMGYLYYYFHPTTKILNETLLFGTAIFSKFPIIDSGFHNPYPSVHSEGLSFADINIKGELVRVISAKFESLGFATQDYSTLHGLKNFQPGNLGGVFSIFKRLKNSYKTRGLQVSAANSYITQSPYPVIFCSTLDDIPNSPSYFTARGDLKDCFLEKGSGFGRTFGHVSPTLRIDYIFASPHFKTLQFTNVPEPYSDHFPLIADLDFP